MTQMTDVKPIEERVSKMIVLIMDKFELEDTVSNKRALIASFQEGVKFWKEVTEDIMKETFNGKR